MGVYDLAECKHSCLQSPACEGVVVTGTGSGAFHCYRKRLIVPSSCDITDGWDLYLADRNWPPHAPPSPPTPPMSPLTILAELNGRFLGGHAANDLTVAGLLVHQHDDQQGSQMWDASWGRLAASLVNAHLPYMFSTSAIGLIVNPQVASRAGVLHCSYSFDGNSMHSRDGGCEDQYGTMHWNANGLASTLQQQQGRLYWHGDCVVQPASVNDRSGCQYNEIVLDGTIWTANLPEIVQAIYYPINGHVDHREGDQWRAATAHADFVRIFGLSTFAPLLTWDVAAAKRGAAPWAVAP